MTQGNRTTNRYALVGIVAIGFALSLVVAVFGPDALSSVASVPAIGSLFWALLEVARDRIAHDRSVFLQDAEHRFSIGATSHMANVAFDKHVEFCEKYVGEMSETLRTLFREGPTKRALDHAAKLSEIRTNATLWLNPNLETELGRYEGAIGKIGAKAWLIDAIHGDEGRPKVVAEMYAQFAEVIGLEKWDDKPVNGDLAAIGVIGTLRKVLGIEELTRLRGELVIHAHESQRND